MPGPIGAAQSQSRASIPGVSFVTTGAHNPQPQNAENDSHDGAEDPELGWKQRSMFKTRTMAGKMSASMNMTRKAAGASTKGATKMASALGRKLRFAGPSGQHQALTAENPEALQTIIGREDDAPERDYAEDPPTSSGDFEDTSALLDHTLYSPQSTPSTEFPRSPADCQDRSDANSSEGCQRSAASSDKHSQGSAGSDNDATGRTKIRFAQPPVQRRDPESWDAKQFANSTRPLECPSIWQIPTSRVPKPEPAPAAPGLRTPTSKQPGSKKSSKKLPAVTVKLSGGQGQRKDQSAGRTAGVVCLSLCFVVAAVVAAMLFLQ